MRGMRVPTSEFNTANLRSLAAASTPTPLSRLQRNATYDKPVVAAQAISIFDLVQDWEGAGYGLALVDAKTDKVLQPYVDPSDYPNVMFTESRDGAKSVDGKYYIKFHSGVLEENPDHLVKESTKADTSVKQAAIYDGYACRVTLECSAGDCNESYSPMTSLLADADIRYREVRRYTIDPDRVCLDILVKKEDLDLIKDLNDASKETGISLTYNQNISEGLKPKQITTSEKDVVKDMPKSAGKKTASEPWLEEEDGTLVNTLTNYRIVPLDSGFQDKFDIEDDKAEVVGHAQTEEEAKAQATDLAAGKTATKKTAARMLKDTEGEEIDFDALLKQVRKWRVFERGETWGLEQTLQTLNGSDLELDSLAESVSDQIYESATVMFRENNLDPDTYNDEFMELIAALEDATEYNYDSVMPTVFFRDPEEQEVSPESNVTSKEDPDYAEFQKYALENGFSQKDLDYVYLNATYGGMAGVGVIAEAAKALTGEVSGDAILYIRDSFNGSGAYVIAGSKTISGDKPTLAKLIDKGEYSLGAVYGTNEWTWR